MKTAVIAVTALLTVVAFAPGQSAANSRAAAPSARSIDSCTGNFPTPLVWLKVKFTDCDTGKSITSKMRRYMQNQLGVGATDEHGYFHHVILGWNCHSRFVGGDEVVMGCRKPVPRSPKVRLIQAFFYID